MGIGEVEDVIADAGAITRLVVGSEHLEAFAAANHGTRSFSIMTT